MKTLPNAPVHPISPDVYDNRLGLTKREYFAALALQGYFSNFKSMNDAIPDDYDVIDFCILSADKMIRRLNEICPFDGIPME